MNNNNSVNKVFLIRSHYPHWGKHSGINQFVRYLDNSRYQIKEHVINRQQSKFAPIRVIKRSIAKILRLNGPKVYTINDLVAELIALVHVKLFGYQTIFYLDGEHSLHLLPKLLGKVQENRNTKIISMFHQPPDKLHTLINPNIFNFLDRVIVLSRIQADDLAKFLPDNKISVLPHGIDIDYFTPKNNTNNNKKFTCLSVGNWLRDYESVLFVARHFELNFPNVEFQIVTNKIDHNQCIKNIRLFQGISDQELLSLYHNADIFFMPMEDATANNAILEALACGLPIITTELQGIKETYLPGDEAILIPPKDTKGYIEAINFLIENRETLATKGLAARQRAIELSWVNFAKSIDNLIIDG